MSRRRRKLPLEPVLATIEALSHEGRGITHVDGKTIFVDGALKGESVMFRYRGSRAKFAEGSIEELIDNISVDRVEPVCKHYSVCGGCSLQHISTEKQIEHKEQVLQEQLQHIGGVTAEQVLPPLTGPLWAYRHKARLGVKHVAKKNKVLVGFREKYSSYVADIDSCEVLHPSAGKILRELGKLISGLSVYNKIAQIEVAVSGQKTVLIFRNLTGLSGEDINKVDAFANQYELAIYLQPGGPSTVMPLPGQDHSELSYLLEEGNISIQFSATDFTQVNVDINQQMVKRVVSLMDIQAADNVLDLYCGLGNFTLPMALKANQITGVEGAEPMVEKAWHNAKLNNIENVNFISADLSTSLIEALRTDSYDKVLLDPPRSGAQFVVEEMKMKNVRRLIYVSCNPATLARDAGILVRDKGFKLVMAGVMDMFPHTSHVESIAVFEHWLMSVDSMSDDNTELRIEISLARQTLRLLSAHSLVKEFPVSSAKNGAGEMMGSECTPRGRHIIAEKIGEDCAINSVFVGRQATGEIYEPLLRAQHAQRDWILTRILWLRGIEPSRNLGGNVDTYERYIYIHGAPDDVDMTICGSHGCVRLGNKDVIDLFDLVTVGTAVTISED